jgi:hypothetical protein
MPRTRDSFTIRISREYWITQEGKKMYAHEFDDEHLSNTLGLLHRQAKAYRLDEALRLCDMVDRIGYEGHNQQGDYQTYKKKVDMFLDPSISDKEWLKQNSKIYVLLMEEANFRGIKANDTIPKKILKSKITGRYAYGNNYSFTWT